MSMGEPHARSSCGRLGKVLKRVKKLKAKDTCTGQSDDDVTIETVKTDTGLAAWQACAGSIVLTTAVFVVNFTTHEAVRSLNEDFGKGRIAYFNHRQVCYMGVREHFGTLLDIYTGWQNLIAFRCDPSNRTDEALYTCFMRNYYPYDQEYSRVSEYCSNRAFDGLTYINYYPCLYYMDLVPVTNSSSRLVSLCSSLWPPAETYVNDTNCYRGVRQNYELIITIYPAEWIPFIAEVCDTGSLTDKELYKCLLSQYYNYHRENQLISEPCADRTSGQNFLYYYPCLNYTNELGIINNGTILLFSLCGSIWPSPEAIFNSPPRALPLLAAENLVSASLHTVGDEKQFGDTLNYVFVSIGLAFVLVGAVVSVYFGYRVVSIIGSILVALGFVFASFIDTDDGALVQILVGGVAGIGTAFLRLSSIVSVLEYFKELRMRVIVMSGLGAVLINFLLIGITFADDAEFYWKTVFRLQLIPAVISLLISFTLKPVLLVAEAVEEPANELQERIEEQKEEVTCITKLSEYVYSRELFRNKVFYLVLGLFFFDQVGRPIFSEGVQPMIIERAYDDIEFKVKIQPLVENIGALIGLGVLLLIPSNQSKQAKRRERMNPELVLQDLARNVTILAALNVGVGILCLIMPSVRSYALILIFSAIYGFTEGMFNSLVQDFIPDGFGRRHIRMMAGFLGFVGGIGSVVAGAVSDGIVQQASNPHSAFYFCAACLFISGAFSIASRFVVLRDAKLKERIKKETDKENRRKEEEDRQRQAQREGVNNPALSEEDIEINVDISTGTHDQNEIPEAGSTGSGINPPVQERSF